MTAERVRSLRDSRSCVAPVAFVIELSGMLHAAVVLARGLKGVYSYDRDLDRIAGVRRVEPVAP